MFRKLMLTAAAVFALHLPAFAEEVFPLGDETVSDEQDRDDAGSGFDTDGGFAIPQDDYDDGDNGDGTWTPDVPEVPEPTPVDTDGADGEE